MFNRKIKVKIIYLIISGILLAAIGFTIWLYKVDPGQNIRLSSILSGLATGLIIMLVQLLLSWYEYSQIESIKSLGVKNILTTREGKDYYAKLIDKTKASDKIYLMGYTAERFMNDFGRSTRDDSNALLNALNRGVEVKILVLHPDKLDATNKAKAVTAKQLFDSVNNSRFEYKYYHHEANHSIVIIGRESLIGPYFPNLQSQDTPCIQILTESAFAKKYIDFFIEEWSKGTAS